MEKLKNFVDGKYFQGFILILIVFNAVIMGIETISGLSPAFLEVLARINTVCLWIFIIEMILKMIAYRLDYFKDGWNWFDMIIIGVSMLSGLPFMASFRALRVLRVLRSLKALRGMRLISSIRNLQLILVAIIQAVPSILWTGTLMILIYYIFALIGVNVFGETFPAWFGTIGKAMYTLFQVMTLESWSMGISRPVMEVYPYAWLYFVPFVLLSSFIVMNVVVGIVVNSISEVTEANLKDTSEDEEEENAVEKEAVAEAEDNNAALIKELAELRKQIDRIETLIDQKAS